MIRENEWPESRPLGHLRNWHRSPCGWRGGSRAGKGEELLFCPGAQGGPSLPPLPCRQGVGEGDRWISPAVSEPRCLRLLYAVAAEEVGESLV